MDSTSRQDSLIETSPGFFGLCGRRILIHISGLLFMGCLSHNSIDSKIVDDFSIGVYLGVICLLHRGVWHEKDWYVPSLIGLLQTTLLFFLGMPLFAAVFWGGVQSWLQRVIRKWNQMGGEWIVLPFLIMACLDYFEGTPALPFPLWPLYTLIALIIAGYIANVISQRVQRETINKDMLASALCRLHHCSQSKELTGDLERQVNIILAQALAIEQAALHSDDKGRRLIAELDIASRNLEKQLKGHMPSVSKGGWSSELFKGKTWDKLTGRQSDQTLAMTLKTCNQKIMAFLRAGKSPNINESTIDSLCVLEQQTRHILINADQAPAKIAKEVESICMLAFEIIKSMRDDPRDRPAGERFLQRYLPATERIAEEYTKLVSSNNTREDVTLAIQRAEEVLARLHQAFSEELTAMLANDSASFTAELNALDKLLKMGGY